MPAFQIIPFTITVKNYQAKMLLGFLPHELQNKQKVLIDVDLTFNQLQMIKDDLDCVFNYQHIIDVIEQTILQPFKLQEFFIQTLSQSLMDVVLKNTPLDYLQPQKLTIRTHKLEAYENAASVGLKYTYLF